MFNNLYLYFIFSLNNCILEEAKTLLPDSLFIINYAFTKDNEYLFIILGKEKSEFGQRIGLFKVKEKIKLLWIDRNRNYNPWKIILKDIDGDSVDELLLGVYKKTKFYPLFERRIFVYKFKNEEIFPLWLGSRLSSPLIDFEIFDIENDGKYEILSLERKKDGSKKISIYKWNGKSLEFYMLFKEDAETLINLKNREE